MFKEVRYFIKLTINWKVIIKNLYTEKELWKRTWTIRKFLITLYILDYEGQIVNICFILLTKATWNNVFFKKIVTSDKNHQSIHWNYLYVWDPRRQINQDHKWNELICVHYINGTDHTNFSSFRNQNNIYIEF